MPSLQEGGFDYCSRTSTRSPGYCNRAVEVHEHAQALAQQAHDQHIELINHQLDTSQAEAAKIAAQLDDTIGELWYSAFTDDAKGAKEAAAILNSFRAP